MLPEKRLTADSIEGDDIVLEYTTAQVVRGHNVRLGPDATSALWNTGARVGEAKKLQQAAG